MDSQAQDQTGTPGPCSYSQSFGDVITVHWTGSTAQPILTVTVNTGQTLIHSFKFSDDSPTQSYKWSNGTDTSSGTFEALFYADGLSGVLNSPKFEWNIGGVTGSNDGGEIGSWDCSTN